MPFALWLTFLYQGETTVTFQTLNTSTVPVSMHTKLGAGTKLVFYAYVVMVFHSKGKHHWVCPVLKG